LRGGEAVMDGADYHVSPDEPQALVQEIVNIVARDGRNGHAA